MSIESMTLGQNKWLCMSDEGRMLAQRSVERLPRSGRSVVTVETRMGKARLRASIAVVSVQPYGCAESYLADVVTGSLYRVSDGRCLTSSARRIVRPTKK